MPCSCPPPSICGVSEIPSRTHKAPMPFGPCILCAEIAIISGPLGMCIRPNACTASHNNSPPWACTAAAISAMGLIVPISLFTSMTANSLHSSFPSPDARGFTRAPVTLTGRTSPCRACTQSRTAACSVAAALTGKPHPIIARLIASVAPEVKITRPSFGNKAAT